MLDGCAGALIVGGLAAAGGGGYAAAQERSVSGAVSDFQIQTDKERAFVNAGPGLQEGVITTVYQGRVLLTGRVATPDMKARATQVAGRVSGIRALYDEVEVAPTGSTWDATKDAWITARLRSGAPVAAGSAPAPLSIKPGPSAPSGAPIEVQKL